MRFYFYRVYTVTNMWPKPLIYGPDMAKHSEIPDRYAHDWLEKLDGRTRMAQAARQRLEVLQDDLGGHSALSYQERSLCRRAVFLEMLLEQREAALAEGREIDEGSHTQSINALMGLWKSLGLKRRAKDVPSLHEYLQAKESGQ